MIHSRSLLSFPDVLKRRVKLSSHQLGRHLRRMSTPDSLEVVGRVCPAHVFERVWTLGTALRKKTY